VKPVSNTFLEQLNKFRVVLFTWSISNEKVTFLNVDITLENNSLKTSVHIKPTKNMQYSQPYRTKKAIVFSLALRGRLLNSTISAAETTNASRTLWTTGARLLTL